MQLGEEVCELGFGSGGAGDDRDDRGCAFESEHDVGCEEPKLLVLVGRGGEHPRPVLLRNPPRVIAADGAANELAEQVAFVLEAGVDGLLRDARLCGDRCDAGAVEAPLLEQRRRGVEHALPRLLGLLEAPLGAVAARLDISGHVHYGSNLFNEVLLHLKEGSTSRSPEVLVRRLIEEGFNQGNIDVADELIAADMVEHQNFGPNHAPGAEGVRAVIASLRRAFSDFHLEIDDLTVDEGTVWLRMTGTGTNDGSFMGNPPTGRTMRTDVFDSLRVENDRIVEHWGIPDRLGALFQLGLERPPARAAEPASQPA
jgi:steroid delta-isomerase-like uncharacterized protein